MLKSHLTIIGGILFAGDHLLGVEQIAVGTILDLIDDVWLQVNID